MDMDLKKQANVKLREAMTGIKAEILAEVEKHTGTGEPTHILFERHRDQDDSVRISIASDGDSEESLGECILSAEVLHAISQTEEGIFAFNLRAPMSQVVITEEIKSKVSGLAKAIYETLVAANQPEETPAPASEETVPA